MECLLVFIGRDPRPVFFGVILSTYDTTLQTTADSHRVSRPGDLLYQGRPIGCKTIGYPTGAVSRNRPLCGPRETAWCYRPQGGHLQSIWSGAT